MNFSRCCNNHSKPFRGNLSNRNSVLLLCDCLTSICKDCARKELVRNPFTYKSYITCPNCKTKVNYAPDSVGVANIINGVEEAIDAEEKLIRRAFAHFGIKHSGSERITNEIKLKACLTNLKFPNETGRNLKLPHDLIEAIANQANSNRRTTNTSEPTVSVDVPYYRHQIARLAFDKLEHVSDDDGDNGGDKKEEVDDGDMFKIKPPNRIDFAHNVALEQYLLSQSRASSHSSSSSSTATSSATEQAAAAGLTAVPLDEHVTSGVNSKNNGPKFNECVTCHEVIRAGCSVQLTCCCVGMMCRKCTLSWMPARVSTYSGVECALCHQISMSSVLNVSFLQQCEDALIESAQAFLTGKLLTIPPPLPPDSTISATLDYETTLMEHYLLMLKIYASLGYTGGSIDVAEAHERAGKSVSMRKARLQVALLEESRLNKRGVVNTYKLTLSSCSTVNLEDADEVDEFTQLAFLKAVEVRKNAFFEHLYCKNSSNISNNSSNTVVSSSSSASTDDSATKAKLLKALQSVKLDPKVDLTALDQFLLASMAIKSDSGSSSSGRMNNNSGNNNNTSFFSVEGIVAHLQEFISLTVLNSKYFDKNERKCDLTHKYKSKITVKVVTQLLDKCTVLKFVKKSTRGRQVSRLYLSVKTVFFVSLPCSLLIDFIADALCAEHYSESVSNQSTIRQRNASLREVEISYSSSRWYATNTLLFSFVNSMLYQIILNLFVGLFRNFRY